MEALLIGEALLAQVHVAVVEAAPTASLDWKAIATELDKKSPLEIMDHVRTAPHRSHLRLHTIPREPAFLMRARARDTSPMFGIICVDTVGKLYAMQHSPARGWHMPTPYRGCAAFVHLCSSYT